MTTHRATLNLSPNLELGNSDTSVEVRADEVLLGTLTLRGGSIDWRPAHKEIALTLSWSDFATLMNGKYEDSR